MQVTILAFAQAHDRLGFGERVVECAPTDTPRQILERIGEASVMEVTVGMRVAVDQEYASWDAPIGEAREIAVIPPVSGG